MLILIFTDKETEACRHCPTSTQPPSHPKQLRWLMSEFTQFSSVPLKAEIMSLSSSSDTQLPASCKIRTELDSKRVVTAGREPRTQL